MATNSNDSFDRSRMSAEDLSLLQDFAARRQLFDQYVQAQQLPVKTCPGCGYPTLDVTAIHEICLVCNWQDDGQDDAAADQVWGGPNGQMSLTENRLGIGEMLHGMAAEQGTTIVTDPVAVMGILRQHAESLEHLLEQNIEGPAGVSMYMSKVDNLMKALTGRKDNQ